MTARGDRWGALRRLGDRYQATDAAADLLSTFPQVTAWDFNATCRRKFGLATVTPFTCPASG